MDTPSPHNGLMSKYPVRDAVATCAENGTHKVETDEFGACSACGEHGDPPTNTWECGNCGQTVERYRGEGDVSCDCGAQYNASGQRLRDNWRDNRSWSDEDIDDMEGYERSMLALESYYDDDY